MSEANAQPLAPGAFGRLKRALAEKDGRAVKSAYTECARVSGGPLSAAQAALLGAAAYALKDYPAAKEYMERARDLAATPRQKQVFERNLERIQDKLSGEKEA